MTTPSAPAPALAPSVATFGGGAPAAAAASTAAAPPACAAAGTVFCSCRYRPPVLTSRRSVSTDVALPSVSAHDSYANTGAGVLVGVAVGDDDGDVPNVAVGDGAADAVADDDREAGRDRDGVGLCAAANAAAISAVAAARMVIMAMRAAGGGVSGVPAAVRWQRTHPH